jgi:glycosyltransferase involved in cell wall biosynthesis
VCLVSREYTTEDHAGGIGTYTEKTARALARFGVAVTVITEGLSGSSVALEDGVDVHRLPPARLTRFGNPPFTGRLARSHAVAAAISRLHKRPDIVQACEYSAEAFWYSLGNRRARLVTRLATPFAILANLNADGGTSRLVAVGLDRMERFQTRRSDVVISPSAALAELVSRRWRLSPDRLRVVPTGVDFSARYAGTSTRLPAELEGHQFGVYFGRLEHRKGVHILAEALPRVFSANPDLHFVFAGRDHVTSSGESMRSLVERCNREHPDRLHFYTQLSHHRLYPIVAGALFAVLPSLWESVSNAALEALDAGTPLIATTGGGFEEVVEHGRSGLLVTPGDARALEESMLALLADRPRLAAMSRQAKARAGCFSLENMVRRLLDVYQELLQEPLGARA